MFTLFFFLALVFEVKINFVYAGANQEQVNKNGTSIVENQIQQQPQSSAAQGAEGNNAHNLNGANLANALNSAESAGAASGQQGAGSIFNMGMSVITGGIGVSLISSADPMTQAMGAFMLLQSAQALMQSLNQGKTSKANKKSGNDFSTYDSINDPSDSNNKGSGSDAKGDDSTLASADAKGINTTKNTIPLANQELLKKMEDLGYKVDLKNGTFTTPNGNSISMSEASKGSAVESKLGLPPGTYAKGMSLVEDLAKRQAATSGGGLDSSGGSGLGGLANESNSLDGSSGSGKKSEGNLGERTPASTLVAGLTSKYNGENIGVAADDIFMMVTRRYQLKNQQDSFITPEHPERGMLINPLKPKQ